MKKAERRSVAQSLVEIPFLLLMGGVSYFGIELAFRGWSHWTMVLCGAFLFLFLYRLNEQLCGRSVFLCALIGAGVITGVELLLGSLVNLWLGWDVWDYSNQPYHLLGQICPLFSLLWYLLCVPVCFFCRLIRKTVFENRHDPN